MESPRTIGSGVIHFFERFIYGGRWVIAPMYVGLLVALGIYTYRFIIEVYHLCAGLSALGDSELMLSVLSLVDTVMIGNLLLLIMIGSYSIFVRRLKLGADSPAWLEYITAGTLKIKMGTGLIGVSSIHLLKDFIGTEATPEILYKHVGIHIVFIVSTIALAYVDRHGHADASPAATATH